MQTSTKNIVLTSYIYIYIYIAIFLCASNTLTSSILTKNTKNDYEITHTNQSNWDLYNLEKQKFRCIII